MAKSTFVMWEITQNLGGGIGGLLQLHQGGCDYVYLYDGKGNVTALLDSTGATAAQYKYDDFGKLVAESATLNQPFQFSTKRYDPDTGLVYYGYRFYNPAIERWMNRDPLGEEGGINLYGFTGNNPVNWIDPWGLIKYNTTDTSKTGRLTGDTLSFAECLEKCAGCELTVTGGSEKTGHSEGSKHYTGEAVDFSLAKNPNLTGDTVKKCYEECAKSNYYGQKEGGTYPHWHFQIVPGQGNATGLKK